MDITRKKPCIGDRVKIAGFLGAFEVVQVRQNGLMTDLKHLGLPGPDYIEREVLAKELIYLNSPAAPANPSTSRPVDRPMRSATPEAPHRSASRPSQTPRSAPGAPHAG